MLFISVTYTYRWSVSYFWILSCIFLWYGWNHHIVLTTKLQRKSGKVSRKQNLRYQYFLIRYYLKRYTDNIPPGRNPLAHFCIGGHNPFPVFCNMDIIPPPPPPALIYKVDKVPSVNFPTKTKTLSAETPYISPRCQSFTWPLGSYFSNSDKTAQPQFLEPSLLFK